MKSIQDLILDIQDRISLPLDDEDRWSTAALVRTMNNVMDDKLTPDLVSEGSNFLVHRTVIELSSNNKSNFPLNSVPIPKRTVGRSVREIKYLPPNKTKIEDEINCPAISLDEKDMYSANTELTTNSYPYVFIENDAIRFIGGDIKGSLVIYYHLEPSTLQYTSGEYATIIGWDKDDLIYNKNSNTIYTTSTTTWTSYINTNEQKYVDIYCKTTGLIIKSNVKLTRGVTSTSGSLTSTVNTISGLSIDEIEQIKTYQSGNFNGMYTNQITSPNDPELLLLPAGKSEFSTIPYEYDQLLVLYTCERVLESLGDTDGLSVIMEKIKETKESISRVTGNRLQGERRKLTDRRSIARIQRGSKYYKNYVKSFT